MNQLCFVIRYNHQVVYYIISPLLVLSGVPFPEVCFAELTYGSQHAPVCSLRASLPILQGLEAWESLSAPNRRVRRMPARTLFCLRCGDRKAEAQ